MLDSDGAVAGGGCSGAEPDVRHLLMSAGIPVTRARVPLEAAGGEAGEGGQSVAVVAGVRALAAGP
jgi:hypothetical protein